MENLFVNKKSWLFIACLYLFSSCIGLESEDTSDGRIHLEIIQVDGDDDVLNVHPRLNIFDANEFYYGAHLDKGQSFFYEGYSFKVKKDDYISFSGKITDSSPISNAFSIENSSEKEVKVILTLYGGWKKNKSFIDDSNYHDIRLGSPMFVRKEVAEAISKKESEELQKLWDKLRTHSTYIAVKIPPKSTYVVPWGV